MNARKPAAITLPFIGVALALVMSSCGAPDAQTYAGIKPLVTALNDGGFHCPPSAMRLRPEWPPPCSA